MSWAQQDTHLKKHNTLIAERTLICRYLVYTYVYIIFNILAVFGHKHHSFITNIFCMWIAEAPKSALCRKRLINSNRF